MKKTILSVIIWSLFISNAFAMDISQRREQIKKQVEKLYVIANQPINEKYGVIFDGYDITNVGMTQTDVVLKIRITQNQKYHREYNKILKNISSDNANSSDVWIWGGNYRLEAGKLVNARYLIPKDAQTPVIDEIHAQIYVNNSPVDKCREYRDNLIVDYSLVEFTKNFVILFLKAIMQRMNGAESSIDKKYNNVMIQNSKIIPPSGLPMEIKYRIADGDERELNNLQLSLDSCPASSNYEPALR